MIVKIKEKILTIVDAPKESDSFDYFPNGYTDYLIEEGMITDDNKTTSRSDFQILGHN